MAKRYGTPLNFYQVAVVQDLCSFIMVYTWGPAPTRRAAGVLFAVVALVALAALSAPGQRAAARHPENSAGNTCEEDACGATKPSPADRRSCAWDTVPDGAHKPVGCSFCNLGKCVNKLPGGASYEPYSPEVCRSGSGSGGICDGDCEGEGCGAAHDPPSDTSVCAWATEPSGAYKPAGCAYCAGGRCVNKLPDGAPSDDKNNCQSAQVLDGKCSACERDGCGAAHKPPDDTSVCAWDTEPNGANKPAGCAYCNGGVCVNKLPNGTPLPGGQPAGTCNECQSDYGIYGTCQPYGCYSGTDCTSCTAPRFECKCSVFVTGQARPAYGLAHLHADMNACESQ